MPLRAPPPADARQTMHTAFKELESTITTDDSRDFHSSTLPRVRDEALDIESRLASRGSLRNMRRLMPLFTALEHYSKAIDVLCNGTPYMPWIWAPITLVLRIASEYVEAFEQLIKAYSRIAASLQRFELLGHAFNGDTQFQRTLGVFYADILEFHKHAYKFVRRSGWRLLFRTSWGRFQRRFDNILEDMKRHEALIDQEANTRDIFEAMKMRQELRAWKEKSLEIIDTQDRQQSSKEFRTVISWLQINESDQLRIFESTKEDLLDPYQLIENVTIRSGQVDRHPETCTWVPQNRQFRNWMEDGPNAPVLWLTGNAGFGKSVIATQVVNFIKVAGKTCFHHFCTCTSPESSKYDQVLKSLLQQVLREDTEWTSYIYNDLVLKRKSATIPVLERLVQTVLTSAFGTPNIVKYIRIVLDGVDELPEHIQMRLLSLVKQISGVDSSAGGVCCKFLISGRSSRTLAKVLGKKPKLSLTDQKRELTKAIEEYSRQRLEGLGERFDQMGMETQDMSSIGITIAKKADGMFLYARLVLDYLSTNIFLDQKELRDSIHNLPKELSEFYRKVLGQILVSLDKQSVEHIKCVFGWLAFSRRPLQKHELLSAVCFSSGNPDVRHPSPEYILSACGPLIEERSDATVTFIHVSVQEFLQNTSSNLVIDKQVALQQHCLATVTCLLSSFQLLDESSDKRYQLIVRGLYDFQIYAFEYWVDYLLDEAGVHNSLEPDSQLYHLMSHFSSLLEGLSGPDEYQYAPSELEMDTRLCRIQRHPLIFKHVKTSLQERSLEGLENNWKQLDDGTLTREDELANSMRGDMTLLVCYQKAVAHILHAREIPGISANELESFRLRSRNSAYTCRLRSCPRATLGFDSAKARNDHEVGHARRFHCTSPSCQYPPFYSSQQLQRHMREKHSMAAPRRAIRQPGTMHQRENEDTPAIAPQCDKPTRHTRFQIQDSPVLYMNNNGALDSGDIDSVIRPDGTVAGVLFQEQSDSAVSRTNARGQAPEKAHLSEAERENIRTMTKELMKQASDVQKSTIVQSAANQLAPQRLAELRAEGWNPLETFYEEAAERYVRDRRQRTQQQDISIIQMQPFQRHPIAQHRVSDMTDRMGSIQYRTTLSSRYTHQFNKSTEDLWMEPGLVDEITGDEAGFEQLNQQQNESLALSRLEEADERVSRADERVSRADERVSRADERVSRADERFSRAEGQFARSKQNGLKDESSLNASLTSSMASKSLSVGESQSRLSNSPYAQRQPPYPQERVGVLAADRPTPSHQQILCDNPFLTLPVLWHPDGTLAARNSDASYVPPQFAAQNAVLSSRAQQG